MVPESALYVRLVMGTVVDYFKPLKNSSWCEMLKSNNKHEWSATGVDGSWVTPDYDGSIATNFGGSSDDWPLLKVEGDRRRRLSFWWEDSQPGGCCSASTAISTVSWGNAFTLSFGAVPHSHIISQLDKMTGHNVQLTALLKALQNQMAQVTTEMQVSKNHNQQLAVELKFSENQTEQLTADIMVLERLSVQLTEDLAAEKELHDACTAAGCEATSGNGRTNKTKNSPSPNSEKQSCSNSAVGGLAGVIALLVVAVVYLLVRNHGNQKLWAGAGFLSEAADSRTRILRTVVGQAEADLLDAVVAGGDRSPALDDEVLYENEEGNISQVVTLVDAEGAVYAEPYEAQRQQPEYEMPSENQPQIYDDAKSSVSTSDPLYTCDTLAQHQQREYEIPSENQPQIYDDAKSSVSTSHPLDGQDNGNPVYSSARYESLAIDQRNVITTEVENRNSAREIYEHAKSLPEAERQAQSETKRLAFKEQENKYNTIFDQWALQPWIEALATAHDTGDKVQPKQPNPWAESDEIEPSSKRYLERIIDVFNGKNKRIHGDPTADVHKWCKKMVKSLGKNGEVFTFSLGPTKDEPRAMQKGMTPGMTFWFDQVRDYGRGSFIVTKGHEAVIAPLVKALQSSNVFDLARAKNRLSPDWEVAKSAGYRDYQAVVRLKKGGWLFEIQIIPQEIYRLKIKLGHDSYESDRAFGEASERARATEGWSGC
jgi:hypothetical protein